MQKRVKTAGLPLLFLERPDCLSTVGPWLAPGNLDFRKVPSIPCTDKNSSFCLLQAIQFMLNICFSFWSLKSGHMLGRGFLYNLPVSNKKTLGNESLTASWQASFHRYHHKSLLAVLSMSHVAPLRRGLLQACAWFPPDFMPHALSLCWFYCVWFCCNK